MKNRNILECSPSQIPDNLVKSKTINLNQRESLLFHDIHEHPLSGVVERYRRLMLSRRNGDVQKNALIEHGLIEPVDIPTRSGRMVLLEITADGWDYLAKTGIKKDIRFNEGIEHRFWKQKIAELFQNEGYTVQIEEPINGFTDIVIAREGKRLPIEVETGKSDWIKNVEKNLKKGFDAVIIVATNQDCFLKIQRQLSEFASQKKILLKLAQELVRL